MNIFTLLKNKAAIFFLSFLLIQLHPADTKAQMRKVYQDVVNNNISSISFYTPTSGYISFTNWIGFTADSGKTFIKRYITNSNVNFNGYSVNLTFGFGISGVKAFDQNNIVVYGDYGWVPAILVSSNGGVNYKLIFHSQFAFTPDGPINDMVFPGNGSIGYAADADRILKTTNQGQSWTVVRTEAGSNFQHLEAVDDNTIFAFSTDFSNNKLVKTTDGGSTWQQVATPSPVSNTIFYANFITANKGWLNIRDHATQNGKLYYTSNGGITWTQKNNTSITPFLTSKMKFFDDSTGIAIGGMFTTFKTTDSGRVWEPLPRDNNFSVAAFTHNDFQNLNSTQFWAGGGNGFLELTTNGGGTPVVKAFFDIDKTQIATTGVVNLVNYSNAHYNYKWYKNDTLISTSYHADFVHNIYQLNDVIKLIVYNNTTSDTAIQNITYPAPIFVTAFTPTSGNNLTTVTITGSNFLSATGVYFGNTPAASFSVISATQINAAVGQGASGSVKVVNDIRKDSLPGFTYTGILMNSFTPTAASIGNTVTISGSNFQNAIKVKFGGTPASSFSIINSNTITAVVGPGTTGSVSVEALYDYVSLPGFVYSGPSVISSFTPAIAGPRTVVTITGINLTGATAVSFGGIPAISFTVVSASTILATVSAAGASGNVSVTTPSGGTAILSGFVFTPIPVISSFAPATGVSGTPVVIRGSNFSAVPANNFVYFGAVAAAVTAASDTELVVTVPAGASFAPITVTNNHLTAVTNKPFIVTFPGAGATIPANSFTQKTDFASPNNPQGLFYDFDGDGKSDMITMDQYNYTFSVARNISANDSVLFAAPLVFSTGTSFNAPLILIKVADLDGDGKLDMILRLRGTDYGECYIYTYKNISSPGIIAFEPKVSQFFIPGDGSIGGSFEPFFYADFDSDGKIDLLTWHANQSAPERLYFYRNNSFNGSISFAAVQTLYIASSGEVISSMCLGDVNNDKKTDIVFTQNSSLGYVSVIPNTSVNGNISFGAITRFNTNEDGIRGSQLVDLDNDDLPDLVIKSVFNRFTILKNVSTAGAIAFSGKTNYPLLNSGSPVLPTSISCADMDGDSKPDIAVSVTTLTSQPEFIYLYKNVSIAGTILLAPSTNITVGNKPGEISIQDLSGDGKPELAFGNGSPNAVSVLLNKIGGVLIKLCANGSGSVTSNVSGTNYQWQLNTGSGFVNINNNTNFSGAGSITLQLNNIPALWDGYQLKCVINGTLESSVFSLSVSNQANAGNDIATCTGSSVQLNGSGGNTYSWLPAAGLSNAFIANPVATPSTTTAYILTVSNLAGCFSKDTVLVTVNPVTTPAVTIASSTNSICAGSSVSFTTSATNEGNNPAYQWQVNGINTGGGSNTFTSNLLKQNDQVKVILTSNYACAAIPTATSNIITMQVQPALTTPLVVLNDHLFTVTNPDTALLYTWQTQVSGTWNDVVPAATGTSYTAATAGEYRVKAVKGVCTVYSTSLVSTSRIPSVNPFGVYLYPNPANRRITVDSIKLSQHWETLVITDVAGKRVSPAYNIQNKSTFTLDVYALKNGIYFIQLRKNDGEITTIKFIKQ